MQRLVTKKMGLKIWDLLGSCLPSSGFLLDASFTIIFLAVMCLLAEMLIDRGYFIWLARGL